MILAQVYAKALYEACQDAKLSTAEINTIEDQLDQFVSAVGGSREAKVALMSRMNNSRDKASLIDTLGKKLDLKPLLIQFLILMARKGRLSLLREVRDSFGMIRLHAEGGIQGQLVAADAMNESDVQGLAQSFTQKFGKKVAFRVSTDASLLAGMKVTVNGVTYDGTLRAQLQKLRDRLVQGLPH
jgi:F-type H+-transporting ATPase subunit delta